MKNFGYNLKSILLMDRNPSKTLTCGSTLQAFSVLNDVLVFTQHM